MNDKTSTPNDEMFQSNITDAAIPDGVDRRSFLMRNAAIGAAAVMTGTAWTSEARAQRAAQEAAKKTAQQDPKELPQVQSSTMSPDLDVVKRSKGPVMMVLDEFYKVGPGPSSSHTMGPMRITHDFFQRVSKLPQNQLKRATALKVRLFGSLSQTGEGHGTNRAALAGLLGQSPGTCPPIAEPRRHAPRRLFGRRR